MRRCVALKTFQYVVLNLLRYLRVHFLTCCNSSIAYLKRISLRSRPWEDNVMITYDFISVTRHIGIEIPFTEKIIINVVIFLKQIVI